MKGSPSGPPAPGERERRALVVVEDSQAQRHLKEALFRVGYSADVYSALRLIPADPGSSVHSFLILQGGEGGLDIPRQLRRKIGAVPVIVLSGAPGSDPFFQDYGPGSVLLSTPYTLLTLQLAIARVLEHSDGGEGDHCDSVR